MPKGDWLWPGTVSVSEKHLRLGVYTCSIPFPPKTVKEFALTHSCLGVRKWSWENSAEHDQIQALHYLLK